MPRPSIWTAASKPSPRRWIAWASDTCSAMKSPAAMERRSRKRDSMKPTPSCPPGARATSGCTLPSRWTTTCSGAPWISPASTRRAYTSMSPKASRIRNTAPVPTARASCAASRTRACLICLCPSSGIASILMRKSVTLSALRPAGSCRTPKATSTTTSGSDATTISPASCSARTVCTAT